MKKLNSIARRATKSSGLAIAGLIAVSASAAQYPLAVTQHYAHQGIAHAQYILGTHYANGDGVNLDYKQAAAWYGKAAQQGHPVALHDLADLHEEGLGVPQSFDSAKALAKKACSLGYKPSCDMYARMQRSYK